MPPDSGMAAIMDRNIRALLARRCEVERRRGLQERLADRITRFTGSMTFVYIHLVFFAVWIVVNLNWLPIRPFDPSFSVLAMVASVEAIFLSTFVLITQNRMAENADQRADLDLQISLLAEHETTRLITLVDAIASRLNLAESKAPGLEELKQDVKPEKVLDHIEKTEANAGSSTGR